MIITKPIQIAVVDEEFAALLAKHAIRRVSRMSLALVSWMFVVPKKDGGWRPINLKWLNRTFLDAPCFWMDTIQDAVALLRSGDLAALVNFKDAYFHIHRRFLRFGWQGLYEYMVLPFGLCLALLIFTMVTKPLQAFLHTQGI